MENYAKSNCSHPHSKPRKASSRTKSSRRSAASRCPRCWATTRQASRWTPTPTSPPTHSSKRRKRWGASSPVRYRPFRYPLPLGSAFGSEKSSGRKQQLMQTKRPEALRFRVFLARREGFEPPAFWSVGCLKGKSEPFRLRFTLFTTVHSADLPLFPSSPARFFRILGQNWVKEDFVITKQKLSACENVYLRKRLIQLMLIEQQILSHSKTDNIAVSCNQMKHFRQLLHKIILFEFASRCSQSRVLPRGKNNSQ